MMLNNLWDFKQLCTFGCAMLQVIYLRKKTFCFQTNKQTKARTKKIFFFCRQAADEIFKKWPRIFLWFQVLQFSITDRRKNYLRNISVNKCEKVQSDLTLFQFFSSKANFMVAKRWGTYFPVAFWNSHLC